MSHSNLARNYPKTWDYLNQYRKVLGARDKGIWAGRADWYAYARAQNIGTFLGIKLLAPYMTTKLRVTLDIDGDLFFVNITTGGYGIKLGNIGEHRIEYFVGLLNSILLDHCIRQMTNQFRGGYFAVNKQALERLPIHTIDFTDAQDKARHDRMVALVDKMLALHQQLSTAHTAHDRDLIQRQIDATDRAIDTLVYQLYGLTAEEIKIVEG